MTGDDTQVEDSAQAEIVEKTKYTCGMCGFVTHDRETSEKHDCQEA